MQKEGGHSPSSGCVNDACLTHLAWKLAAIALLPPLTLPCSSDDCENSWGSSKLIPDHSGISPANLKHLRPWGWAYPLTVVPPASHRWLVGTVGGRPAISSCRNPSSTAMQQLLDQDGELSTSENQLQGT